MPTDKVPSSKEENRELQPSPAEGDEETVKESIKEHEQKHDQNS